MAGGVSFGVYHDNLTQRDINCKEPKGVHDGVFCAQKSDNELVKAVGDFTAPIGFTAGVLMRAEKEGEKIDNELKKAGDWVNSIFKG